MPRFDNTGPLGKGTMTGRGLGRCGRATKGKGQRDLFWRKNKSQTNSLADYRKALEKELENVKNEEMKMSKEA